MQFKDLKFAPWRDDAVWLSSQPLRYKGQGPAFLFHAKDWKYGKNVFDLDVERSDGSLKTLHEDLSLLELCAGILPFCELLPQEVTDA
jgi:hypothetical protein